MSQESSPGQKALNAGKFALRLGLAAIQSPLPPVALVAAFSQAETHTTYAQAAPVPLAPTQAGNCDVVFLVEAFNFTKGDLSEEKRVRGNGGKVVFNEGVDRFTTPIKDKVVDLTIGAFLFRTITDQYGRGAWRDLNGTEFNKFRLTGPNNSQDGNGYPSFRINVVDQNSGESAARDLRCNTGVENPIRILRYQDLGTPVPTPTLAPDATHLPVATPSAIPSPTERILIIPGGSYPGSERTAVINLDQAAATVEAIVATRPQAKVPPTPGSTAVAEKTRLAKAEATAGVVAPVQTAYAKGIEDASRQFITNPSFNGAARGGGPDFSWIGDNLPVIGIGAVVVGVILAGILVVPRVIGRLRREMGPAAEEPEEPDRPADDEDDEEPRGPIGPVRPIRPAGPALPPGRGTP